ncbi:unnamed protein product [Ostreobium quekettii]|uniref:Uncharacterized protein n=1 Tax=Ostreobium quekettii TaxID=121088 RepID=A0A8S1JHG9_9CHLO|nr:unnamed protein product [Ostreobium quekettii]
MAARGLAADARGVIILLTLASLLVCECSLHEAGDESKCRHRTFAEGISEIWTKLDTYYKGLRISAFICLVLILSSPAPDGTENNSKDGINEVHGEKAECASQTPSGNCHSGVGDGQEIPDNPSTPCITSAPCPPVHRGETVAAGRATSDVPSSGGREAIGRTYSFSKALEGAKDSVAEVLSAALLNADGAASTSDVAARAACQVSEIYVDYHAGAGAAIPGSGQGCRKYGRDACAEILYSGLSEAMAGVFAHEVTSDKESQALFLANALAGAFAKARQEAMDGNECVGDGYVAAVAVAIAAPLQEGFALARGDVK